MADIINLAKRRKARERLDAAGRAAENRVRHGRTLAERKADRDAAAVVRQVTDGARLDGSGRREPIIGPKPGEPATEG